MKVIIRSAKKINESKKKIRETKRLLREFEPISIGIGVLVGALVSALAMLFPKIKELFSGMGQRMESAVSNAQQAADVLPEPAKQQFMDKFNAAMTDLKETVESIQKKQKENPEGSVSDTERPSAMIAAKVSAVLKVIEETKTAHAGELRSNPESMAKLDSAVNELKELVTDISNLDFTSAISSKEDPEGLWAKVSQSGESVKTAFSDPKKWLTFTQKYAASVDKASIANFSKNKLPSELGV